MTERELNQALWAEARALVERMNPNEAQRFDKYVEHWPQWAQNDIENAYATFLKIRELK